MKNKLSILNYSDLWLSFGFLTEEELDEQIRNFETEKDRDSEHYRYSSFIKYLDSRKELTENEIDNFLHLAEIDKDKWMAESAIRYLISRHKNYLTDCQFEKACDELRKYGDKTEKFISREILYRRLRKSVNKEVGLTEDVFQEFLNENDGSVHEYLIWYADKGQLEAIAEKGATKAVRNIAKQELKSRKFK